MTDSQLLCIRDLSVSYRVHHGNRHGLLHAVRAVSLDVQTGTSLGIVGESGSGKSSLARALLRLVPASGSARFRGQELLTLQGRELQAMRRHLQLIFQDPLASLDPRMSISEIIGEPLRVFEPQLTAQQREQRVVDMLQAVGLEARYATRLPHEFSGGQAQRIGIARALILHPALLVCDEPLSALDVSIKAQIANLLKDLQQRLQLTLLFIAHDLASVRFLCDRVLVLYLGRVMELAPSEQLFMHARHPYTQALLRSVPVADPSRVRRADPLAGELPSPLDPPSGCVFRTRCPHAIERCAQAVPALRSVGGSVVACHRAEEIGSAAAPPPA